MTDDLYTRLAQLLTDSRQELLAAIQAVPEGNWETAVFSDDRSWTVTDLLRHVADSERSMTQLMMQIREGGEGVPANFDLARWNARIVEKSRHKSPTDLLTDLHANREALFAFMQSLTATDWQKQGRHGSMQILSIAQICQVIADHEIAHTADMRRAKQ